MSSIIIYTIAKESANNNRAFNIVHIMKLKVMYDSCHERRYKRLKPMFLFSD